MALFVGFLLGVMASLLASFAYAYITNAVPLHRQRPVLAALRNPQLYYRLRRDTAERRVKQRIEALFAAWRRKQLADYLACWTGDAVRIIGTESNVKEDKAMIGAKFSASCKRYSAIEVSSVVFESIRIGPRPGMAMAEVSYRFVLTRAEDALPVVEDAHEVYALREQEGSWIVASNIDHFYEIRRGPS
jgi:Domain of unknown function (DUF4440)